MFDEILSGLEPCVLIRKVEAGPMNRHGYFCFCVDGCLNALFREHVYLRPIHAILPAFHHGKIKGAQSLANFFEMAGIPPISAEPDILISIFALSFLRIALMAWYYL